MKKNLIFFLFIYSVTIFGQQSYYNGLDFSKTGIALKNDLANRITSTQTTFLSYTPGVWEALKKTDVNPSNSSEVLLIYGYSNSGTTARTRGINDNGGDQGDWNREHTFPRSLGNPNLGSSGPGSDAHHLRPSDVSYNGQRGNKKFVDGSGNSGSVSGGWYPGDEWKGDVARMMMFMYLRYGDRCLPSAVGVGSNANTPDDMIDLFLDWNAEDPVSDFERQRNTYHEDTNNTYAQGNRNPFIDNAFLATRIWGGTEAEDSWGIFTSQDTEAPTTPTNVMVSNVTTSSFTVTWTASTDNETVAGYDILLNGAKQGESSATTYNAENLTPNTNYSVTVIAKDIANNTSTPSNAVDTTTLADTTNPSIPTNVIISNENGNSFNVNWTASTDDSGILEYEIYLDGNLAGTSTTTMFSATNLSISTTYSVTVLAEDVANNKSSLSAPVDATTTDGSNNVNELFFSEYIEGSSFNKAIEFVNITGNTIDLSPYSIKRQSRGVWEAPLQLSGTLNTNNVYVIINSDTTNPDLIREADLGIDNVTPMTFNGDDRVGLFKNDVLIDIIGDLDGTDDFAKNITLRRKTSTTEPTIDYNEQRDWDSFPTDTTDDLGNFNGTLSTKNSILKTFKMYPNPTNGNTLNFDGLTNASIKIYNIIGKEVLSSTISSDQKSITISNLKKGIYLVKINSDGAIATKKLIKN